MVGWTAFASGRTPTPVAARLRCWSPTWRSLSGLMLVSPLVKGDGLQRHDPRLLGDGGAAGLGDPLHWRGGLFAGALSGAADLAVRDEVTQVNYGNVFLLLDRRPGRRLPVRVAAADGGRARRGPACRRWPRPSGPGWPGSSTTACCRCSRWSSAAAPSSAVRRPSWPAGRGAGGRAADPDPRRRTRCAPTPSTSVDLAAELAALESRSGVTVATPGVPVEVCRHLVDGAGRRGPRLPRQRDDTRRRGAPEPGCCWRPSRTGRGVGARRRAGHPGGTARGGGGRGTARRQRVDPRPDRATSAAPPR